MSLPSAEYARSKLPTKAEIETAEKKKQDEMHAIKREWERVAEEAARDVIEATYKDGMSSFVIEGTYIPDSVMKEMCDLGWLVERKYHPMQTSPSTLFSLPME